MRLVLASQSPRRSELLHAAGIPYHVHAAGVDETRLPNESPVEYVQRLAYEKASAVPGDLVLGADTIVLADGEVLGKPEGAADAIRMLRLLSGRRHEVITGICITGISSTGISITGRETIRDYETTAVYFAALTEEEIAHYVSTGEPLDKAGAYAIQGRGSRFVQRIEGSYSNVVGLPVALVYSHLVRRGYLSH
jgi:septum formation protein